MYILLTCVFFVKVYSVIVKNILKTNFQYMLSFKHKSTFSQFFITFLTSFLIWIIFSFFIAEKAWIPLSKSILFYENNTFFSQNNSWDLDLERFWEVYNLIKKEGYGIWEINKEQLVDSAIKWLVEWLEDKHSSYMNTEEKTQFKEILSGDFEWIWAIVDKHVLGIEIDRVIKWAPALKYGLKAKDIIISANSIVLQDMDLYEAIGYIKWPAGTKVDLEILREWEWQILNILVIRDKITIPSVNSELLENNIGYIALNMFWDDTVWEFQKALWQLSDTDGLIIDLRDNWGWYLHAATEILSELLEHDSLLVTTKYSTIFKPNEVYKSINYWEPYKNKIIVIINENSASASEIVAWALRDYDKAILVWIKSYGKWSVQQTFDISNNSLLKITIAKWFTPNDKNIDKEGITPDILVELKKEDYTPEEWKESEFIFYDRQLEMAKTVLNEFIQSNSFENTIKKFVQIEENKKEVYE